MPEQKLEINLPEDIAQGTYSNLAIITHTDNEFILDFVAMMPGAPKGNVRSRIVMTPQNVKRLFNSLNENVHRFEERNGRINDGQPNMLPISDNGIA